MDEGRIHGGEITCRPFRDCGQMSSIFR
jgi:hypothetical protein